MRIDNIDELGKLIRDTRKAQGLTQKDLAGVSVRLIVEFENGKRGVNIDSVIKLCSLLGLKIDIE